MNAQQRPVRNVARELISIGIAVVPVPPGSRGPMIKGWPDLRITEDQVDQLFVAESNLSIICGPASGDLIDVDLDCDEAVELAEQYLPPTEAQTGRDARPRSHRWYRCPGIASATRKDPETDEMIVEIRSSRHSTMVGPSIHAETGDRYHEFKGTPAEIDAAVLAAAVTALGDAVLIKRYGFVPIPKKDRALAVVRPGPPIAGDFSTEQKLSRARKYLAQIPGAIEGAGGDPATYGVATCMVHGFELDVAAAFDLLWNEFNPRCQPPWDYKRLLRKCNEAATKPHARQYGWLLRTPPPQQTSRTLPKDKAMTSVPANDLPRIEIDTNETRVIDETVDALGSEKSLFESGGRMVRVTRDDANAPMRIQTVPPAYLRECITRTAHLFERDSKGGECPSHPKHWQVDEVLARGTWSSLRKLVGVTDIPILRPDGTICDTPGYDAVTGYFYDSSIDGLQFVDAPEHVDAVDAVAVLKDIFCDFPLEDEAGLSVILAALLTIVARTALNGCSPLFLVDANLRGAGKTLICQVISNIVTGCDTPTSNYCHEANEMRKQITTFALNGDPIILLDNIEGEFGNAPLDRALTSRIWQDRILGKSEMASLPLRAVWLATSNNVVMSADTARRVLFARLNSPEEKPEFRSGFRYPSLLESVQQRRVELLRAAFTVLSAYLRAGSPKQNISSFGSYEAWSALVRSALVWALCEDPVPTRSSASVVADRSVQELDSLLEAWEQQVGIGVQVTLGELIHDLYRDNLEVTPHVIALRSALEAMHPGKGDRPQAHQLGNALRKVRDRWLGGRCLKSDAKKNGSAVWVLISNAKAGEP